MPQRVTCPTCAKVLSVTAAAAGKAGKCPGCGTRIAFPPEPPAVDELAGWEEFFDDPRAKQKVDPGPPIELSTLGDRRFAVRPKPSQQLRGLSTGTKVALAVLLAVGALGLWAINIARHFAPQRPAPAMRASLVTLANFERLLPGMSYADVVRILGEDGTLMSENVVRIPDFDGQQMRSRAILTRMYMWRSGLGNLSVTFQQNELTLKSQFGLE